MNTRVVYLIAWSASGPTKIGVATDPIKRLEALQTSCPYRLKIFKAFVVQEPLAEDIESEMLNGMRLLRMQGEWIKTSPTTLRAAIERHLLKERIAFSFWEPSNRQIRNRELTLSRDWRKAQAKQRVKDALLESRLLDLNIVQFKRVRKKS